MPNVIQSIINVTQAFANSTPLDPSTTLSFQSLGGTPGEFGIVNPTYGGIWVFPCNFACHGNAVTCEVKLQPGSALMSAMTAGSFTLTLVFNNGPLHSASVSVDLALLQAYGPFSDVTIFLNLLLPFSTVGDGKIRLLDQTVVFANKIVSIGDAFTDAQALRSVVIGNHALADASSEHAVVLGPQARAELTSPSSVVAGLSALASASERTVVIGPNSRATSSARAVVIGDSATADTAPSSVVIGHQAEASSSSPYAIVVGDSSSIRNAFASIIIGPNTAISASNSNVISIGPNNLAMFLPEIIPAPFPYSIAIGSSVTIGQYGVLADYAIAIGYKADVSTIGPGVGSSAESVAIGANAYNESSQTIQIGARSGSYTLEGVVVGVEANDDGPATVVIGDAASCSYSTFTTVVGPQSYAMNSLGGIVIGYKAQIPGIFRDPDACWHCIVIGTEASVNEHTKYGIAIGYKAVALSDYSTVVSSADTGIPSSVDAFSIRASAIGRNDVVETSPSGIALGDANHLRNATSSMVVGQQGYAEDVFYSLAIGFNNGIVDALSARADINSAHVIVGVANTMSAPTDGASMLGVGNAADARNTITIGRTNSNSDEHVLLLGNGNYGINGGSAIWIGYDIYAPGSSAPDSITLGIGALAAPNTLTIGSSNYFYLPPGDAAIHTLTIRGYNGGPVDTLVASDSPAVSGQVGLNIVLNTGAGFVNKDILGNVAPPAGALLLYVD